MSGARLSRKESQARTRRLLLDAARAVFAERGFHGAAVEDVASRAGFTRGAFYANFTDKADALLTLHEEDARASFATLRERLEAASPAEAPAV
ncbi:MAG TPA: TetR family transcriptional regulator, partial [Solirubrobacteraceae bacterium]|nr:TetR family transcriptional regulator [Solirubrobacteraceae bacterium]